jgi:hypothetical protein
MVSKILKFGKQKGSSLALPANGLGGSRATSLLVAHFALQNTASNPAEKNRAKPEKQKGKKEGGWGEGIFALLLSPRRRRGWGGSVSAIPLLAEYQNRTFFFSLIEKNFGGARLKKCREKFSVLLAVAKRRRAETLGGIYSKSASGFSLKKVRISFRIRSQIVCSAFVASPLRGSASPPEAGKADFKSICHAPRGSKNNSRSRKIRFAVAKQQNPANGGIANLFFSPFRASCKAIIIPTNVGIAQKRYY